MNDKPAFPLPSKTVEMLANAGASMDVGGLTRRELFAAMQMAALQPCAVEHGWDDESLASYARHAADALIAELDK